jgi:hypothetical protein
VTVSDESDDLWLAIANYTVHGRDECGHYARGRLVDEVRRKVTCRACGKELDAFQCLLEVAKDHVRTSERLASLKKEAQKVRDRLTNLLREEANARARLKRLAQPRDRKETP